MKKLLFMAIALGGYIALSFVSFLLYETIPKNWILGLLSILLILYTFYAIQKLQKEQDLPWWATWLLLVVGGTGLTYALLIALHFLIPFHDARLLVYIMLGSMMQYGLWLCVVLPLGAVAFYRYWKYPEYEDEETDNPAQVDEVPPLKSRMPKQ